MGNIHRGQLLLNAIKESNVQITAIAEKLGKPRSSLYNFFQNKDLSVEILIKIGKIIKHDFSKDLPELFKANNVLQEPIMPYAVGTPDQGEVSGTDWKRKYFDLLEEHNKTLRELNRFIRAQKK